MSLESLLAKLDTDAAAEREAVLSEARNRADQIRTESARTLNRMREERLGAAQADEDRKALAQIAAARADARRIVLDARRLLAELVRAEVERMIERSAGDADYLERVTVDLRAAALLAPPGRATLRVDPDLSAQVEHALPDLEAALARERTVSHDAGAAQRQPRSVAGLEVTPDADIASGFMLLADGGSVVVDGRLGPRLRLAWPRLAAMVLRELES